MAKNNDDIIDDTTDDFDEDDSGYESGVAVDKSKLDARRKLEEYMELKRLRELTDY